MRWVRITAVMRSTSHISKLGESMLGGDIMVKVTTAVDAIEEALGEKITPKLLKRPNRIDSNLKKAIAQYYRRYEEAKPFLIFPKEKGEIFPYIHPRYSIRKGIGGPHWEHPIQRTLENIKALLLYYHRISVPDGFSYVCDYYLEGCPDPDPNHSKFLAYLRLFIELRELVQNGILFFMPEFPSFFPARDAVKALPEPDDWESWEREFGKQLGDGPFYDLRTILEETLWVCKNFDLDLFLPGSAMVDFFNLYCQLAFKPIPLLELKEASAGALLLTCELPLLSKVRLKDIISIRRGGEGFAIWRAKLRNILNLAYDDFLKGTFNPNVFRRIASEELAEGREKINAEIKKSHYLTLAKAACRSIGIGLLTSLVLSPTGVIMALPTAGVSTAITFLWDYIAGKRSIKEQEALKAHYAVFG